MGSTRDNMQAGPQTEIPVIAPNGSLSHQSQSQALAVVAPRSSSLPIFLMGHSASKQRQPSNHHQQSPAPSLASKSFPAVISLKRAFAARRKKSDVDRDKERQDVDSRSVVGSYTFPRNTQPKVEITPSSASSPPQVPSSSTISPPSQSRGAKQQLSQLASHVFTTTPKKPQPTTTTITTTAAADSLRPLPPPPLPPKSSVSESVPSTTLHARSHVQASLHPSPASLEQNRSSIMPMSPAIESAVSYMTMTEQLQQQQQQEVVSLASPSPSSQPTALMLTLSSSSSLSSSPAKPVQTSLASDGPTIPAKPLMTTHQDTTAPEKPPHTSTEVEVEELKRVERPRARSDSDGALLEREYADKRKSDSTISHYTIRPGAGGGPRSSRPVSMAESFQSSYTIVPANGGTTIGGVMVVNKRLSAVDPDYSLLEEDDDSFKSLDDDAEGSGSCSGGDDQRTSAVWVQVGEEKVSPPNSLLRQKRRSMSLNVGASNSSSKVQLPHPPPTASAAELKHPSYSISEGFYSHPLSASSSSIAMNRPQQPNGNRKLPAIPPLQPHPNVNATFTYPTQRPLPNHPAPPASFRQTAVSITSSLAPAAGLARKAVEKVKGALGHMGSSPSSHGHHHHHHHGTGSTSGSISSASISSTSGYSSSISVSSTAPSSFPPNNNNEWVGGLNLARTSSNQSSAATHGSSMHAVNIKEIKERSERERQSGKKREKEKRMRRTPNGQSGGTYSVGSIGTTATTTSGSDSDAFMMPSGAMLGVQLRGPMTNRHGVPVAGGVVFGRDLRRCVKDTGIWVGKGGAARGTGREDGKELMGRHELRVYEQRMLPAIVVRCAQHLLIWGVQEEGLFRVPGRAAHIARLKSEFDTGVDYDMSGCTPGDLDPHAVASIFKAYLRELPEHILTQKLSPYFDAAIDQESSAASAVAATPSTDSTSPMRKGVGLPTSQKPGRPVPAAITSMSPISPTAGFTSTNLRKPPSLSTLAMPSFSAMRPASHNLISALRSLIAALPRENRDLLRTVVELIQATARESKLTKMPLSNLLMVFLPSLNISAQLLRVLCEEERIWVGPVEGGGRDGNDVLDVKRDTVVLDIRPEGEEESGEGQGDEGEDEDEDDIDAQRRWTVVQRPEVPTVYLDSRSQASSASLASSALVSSSRDASVSSTTESSILSSDRHDRDAMLSSSVESVSTPLTLSTQSSQAYLALDKAKGSFERPSSRDRVSPRIHVVEPTSPSLEFGVLSGAEISSVNKEDGQARKFAISSPLPYKPSPTPPPKMATTENNNPSPTSPNPRRRSIPALSFPGLSVFTGGHSHRNSQGSFGSGSHGSEPASPADSMVSTTGGKQLPAAPLRTNKPPLRLLFSPSKKSSGSLKDVIAVNTPGSAPGSAGSHSFSSYQQQYQARTASMVLAVSASENSGSSDSSVSTPLSAVTAPGTAMSSSFSCDDRRGGGMAESRGLDRPPALDTPLEEETSLRSELGLDISPPMTANAPTSHQGGKGKEKKERIKTMIGQTPIADWYSTKSAASSVVDLPAPVNKSQHELEVGIADISGAFSHAEYDEDDDGNGYDVEARRRTVIGRSRGISVSSRSSMNHLGLEDEELGAEDDWTKTVLLAADFELGKA